MNVDLRAGYPRILSLCSGVGGLDLGVRRALPTSRVVAYIEREAFAAANLVARFQEEALDPAPVFSDLTTFDGRRWRGAVDLVVSGVPCQPVSVAGKRKGKDDQRWLWPHVARLLEELDFPPLFFENVAGIVSKGLDGIYADLQRMGYGVEGGIFSAAEVGAPHIRKRVFFLACRDDGGAERLLAHTHDPRVRVADESGWVERTGGTGTSPARGRGTHVMGGKALADARRGGRRTGAREEQPDEDAGQAGERGQEVLGDAEGEPKRESRNTGLWPFRRNESLRAGGDVADANRLGCRSRQPDDDAREPDVEGRSFDVEHSESDGRIERRSERGVLLRRNAAVDDAGRGVPAVEDAEGRRTDPLHDADAPVRGRSLLSGVPMGDADREGWQGRSVRGRSGADERTSRTPSGPVADPHERGRALLWRGRLLDGEAALRDDADGCGGAPRRDRAMADAYGGTWNGLHERLEEGHVAPDARGARTGAHARERTSGVPFPPGPADVVGWEAYLEVFPGLAPAVEVATGAEPVLRGGPDELADRVDGPRSLVNRIDRLRACGNGVVPVQAAYAFIVVAEKWRRKLAVPEG